MKKQIVVFLALLISSSSVFWSQVPSYVPTNGLVGWWPFNGNANDESGNGNNGTVNGAALTTDRFGIENKAYNFDLDSIQIVNDTIFDLNHFSISCWINATYSSPNYQTVFGHFYDSLQGSYYGYWIGIKNDKATLFLGDGNSQGIDIQSTQSVNDGNWHFITGIYSNNVGYIYVDGKLEASAVYQMALTPSITTIGYDYISEYFVGKIDDIGIWNRNLTDCEIKSLYSSGAPLISVFNDLDQNCTQNLELGIHGVSVVLNPGNIISTSNYIGQVFFPSDLADDTYTAMIDTTNLNWSNLCSNSQFITIQNGIAECEDVGFGLVNSNPCSDPDVSIYTPSLRRCFSNQRVYVSACNQTTATGVLSASFVDVELDPLMTITSASLPYSSQGNNVFRFQTGNLNPGQCVNFNISTTISCNAMLGQTLCMDANLYPVQSCALDTIQSDPIINNVIGGTLNGFPQTCTLPWDQSSLIVDGWCQEDSVYFSITNTGDPGGGDMECYSPMWVTVDGVVTYTDSIMIPGGQTVILSYFGNGQTWILNAEQHPLHPGNFHPSAHVEACGDTANWTPDIVNDFPQDDADAVVDIYCGVVTGSYDPNDKTGFPIGQTDQKYIQPNQQLQYVIRFQNTGTDTAFTVVIRDTLDTDLNIFTVTSGVSSHQYDFRMYGPRVLEWTFNNINLPDSSTNQEGSNGFVTFHVDQVPNLDPGTEITNDADIYFDFNDPITTNTTMHRIFEGFVSVLNVEELTQNGKSLLVYPNPTSQSITIKGEKNMNQSFSIYDQMGREVFKGKLNGISTEVNLSILSKGIYTLKIDGKYKPAQIVKE
jgi:uncharacterized repeat protein (TIGR01451 family)